MLSTPISLNKSFKRTVLAPLNGEKRLHLDEFYLSKNDSDVPFLSDQFEAGNDENSLSLITNNLLRFLNVSDKKLFLANNFLKVFSLVQINSLISFAGFTVDVFAVDCSGRHAAFLSTAHSVLVIWENFLSSTKSAIYKALLPKEKEFKFCCFIKVPHKVSKGADAHAILISSESGQFAFIDYLEMLSKNFECEIPKIYSDKDKVMALSSHEGDKAIVLTSFGNVYSIRFKVDVANSCQSVSLIEYSQKKSSSIFNTLIKNMFNSQLKKFLFVENSFNLNKKHILALGDDELVFYELTKDSCSNCVCYRFDQIFPSFFPENILAAAFKHNTLIWLSASENLYIMELDCQNKRISMNAVVKCKLSQGIPKIFVSNGASCCVVCFDDRIHFFDLINFTDYEVFYKKPLNFFACSEFHDGFLVCSNQNEEIFCFKFCCSPSSPATPSVENAKFSKFDQLLKFSSTENIFDFKKSVSLTDMNDLGNYISAVAACSSSNLLRKKRSIESLFEFFPQLNEDLNASKLRAQIETGFELLEFASSNSGGMSFLKKIISLIEPEKAEFVWDDRAVVHFLNYTSFGFLNELVENFEFDPETDTLHVLEIMHILSKHYGPFFTENSTKKYTQVLASKIQAGELSRLDAKEKIVETVAQIVISVKPHPSESVDCIVEFLLENDYEFFKKCLPTTKSYKRLVAAQYHKDCFACISESLHFVSEYGFEYFKQLVIFLCEKSLDAVILQLIAKETCQVYFDELFENMRGSNTQIPFALQAVAWTVSVSRSNYTQAAERLFDFVCGKYPIKLQKLKTCIGVLKMLQSIDQCDAELCERRIQFLRLLLELQQSFSQNKHCLNHPLCGILISSEVVMPATECAEMIFWLLENDAAMDGACKTSLLQQMLNLQQLSDNLLPASDVESLTALIDANAQSEFMQCFLREHCSEIPSRFSQQPNAAQINAE